MGRIRLAKTRAERNARDGNRPVRKKRRTSAAGTKTFMERPANGHSRSVAFVRRIRKHRARMGSCIGIEPRKTNSDTRAARQGQLKPPYICMFRGHKKSWNEGGHIRRNFRHHLRNPSFLRKRIADCSLQNVRFFRQTQAKFCRNYPVSRALARKISRKPPAKVMPLNRFIRLGIRTTINSPRRTSKKNAHSPQNTE